MIGHIHGTVFYSSPQTLIITAGGIGHTLFVPERVANKYTVGTECSLWTYLAVKENALELYGFEKKEEKDLFELLLSVSGVGPKSAMAIIGIAPLETLVRSIASGDVSLVQSVSGIGKKTAQKIILELSEKFAHIDQLPHVAHSDALEALIALGYQPHHVREVLAQIDDELLTTQQKITRALQLLQ